MDLFSEGRELTLCTKSGERVVFTAAYDWISATYTSTTQVTLEKGDLVKVASFIMSRVTCVDQHKGNQSFKLEHLGFDWDG